MYIKIQRRKNDENNVFPTFYNTDNVTLSGNLFNYLDNNDGTNPISIKNPTIELYSETDLISYDNEYFSPYNYCSIDWLNDDGTNLTYYYIRDINLINTNRYELVLEYDYLYNEEWLIRGSGLILRAGSVPSYVDNPNLITTGVKDYYVKLGNMLGQYPETELNVGIDDKLGDTTSASYVLCVGNNNTEGSALNLPGLGYYGISGQSVINALYTTDFSAEIEKKYLGKGADAINSLKMFPGLSLTTNNFENIFVGAVDIGAVGYPLISSHETDNLWIHGFPSLSSSNYQDREPYTTIDLFIPGYGFYNLKPEFVSGGKSIAIDYKRSLIDGTASAGIYCIPNGTNVTHMDTIPNIVGAVPIDVLNFDCSIDLPLTIDSYRTGESVLSNIAVGAVKGGAAGGTIGSFGGPVGTAIGTVGGAIAGAASQLSSYDGNHIRTSGSSGAALLNNSTHRLYAIITTNNFVERYNTTYDYASEINIVNATSFHNKVLYFQEFSRPVSSDSTSSTTIRFYDETVNKLRNGFIWNT